MLRRRHRIARRSRFRQGWGLLTALVVFAGSPPQKERFAINYEYKIDYIYDTDLFVLIDAIKANAESYNASGANPGWIETRIRTSTDSLNPTSLLATFEIGKTSDHTRLRLRRVVVAQGGFEEPDPIHAIEEKLIAKLPPYRSRHERMFYTDAHNAPGGPLFMIVLAVLPLTYALTKRVTIREAWKHGKRKYFSIFFASIAFVLAVWLIGTAIYYLVDAIYVGGPYIETVSG